MVFIQITQQQIIKQYKTFCVHSNKILPIREKTYGLTLPQDTKPLREVLTQLQLENVNAQDIAGFREIKFVFDETKLFIIRTKTDKIHNPYIIFNHGGQDNDNSLPNNKINKNVGPVDQQIFYKLAGILYKNDIVLKNFHEYCLNQLNSQLTIMSNLIFGIHPHSAKLYQDKLNINLKSFGFIDFFVMSDNGLLPFRSFFKGISNLSKPNQFDYQISVIVSTLILDLCQKSKSSLLQGTNQSKTMLVLDQIINCFKKICESNQQIKAKFNENLSLISRVQSLYFKFRPNKSCPLRKIITRQQSNQLPSPQNYRKNSLNQNQKIVNEVQLLKLQQRIKKLQALVTAPQSKSTVPEKQQIKYDHLAFERPNIPVQNLGQEMFLGSLQWALQNGDIQTAKKLTKWRKSLLQVGRITGWEVALAIGARTYKKQQITPIDIIQANYQHLSKTKKTT